VLGLHGAGQDAYGFEAESAFTEAADEHRFVIAYPMSWRPRGFWRYPEPDGPRSGLRYLRATIDAVARTQCVDSGRVLVTGISSGGRMTYAAGCELADRLLAIAPVSGGTRQLPPCHPARPISIVDTHGTSVRRRRHRQRPGGVDVGWRPPVGRPRS
jgi:polyhydroxybutyrate depolymerase